MTEDIGTNGDTSTGTVSTASTGTVSTASQTHSRWVEPMDLMSLVAEKEILLRDYAKCTLEHLETKRQLNMLEEKLRRNDNVTSSSFTVDVLMEDESHMHYYTGFSKDTFNAIFKFLVPDTDSCPLKYVGKGNLSQIKKISFKDQLLLTLCKLRNDSDLQDRAFRFSLTKQVVGVVFNSWVNYMYLRFGEVCIWPPRDVIYEHMPGNYRQEFPDTFSIIDCTEIRIQKPSSLNAQSQTYSTYKSCNTLKALVAVDPRGSVIFSSMLFAGSISDKEIYKKSGFQSMLIQLVEIGYLKTGDGIMADKGFDIVKEVEDVGLKLNIPPFAKSGIQMNSHDVNLTQKIAKHRVHVERAIRRIKSFKILSGRISLSLMSSIAQIWYVCSFLTNFMPLCIKRK
ncbi:uncharacterized protein LOC133509230 isoform X1 [Syngnathoides biaculeatus]|uniref:uncharacterized protein LOC133509230 isoform X1 n=1 Tax=Syngnathoides biaculeatus TaxID=300417 RepID=UPI002ADE76C2|nr:uncharacterized protein LOC133509230 isoform X1 [Syngnathoides biaculeatus]XP_061692085.1 uncharacterized protein LOC133509230 isoform X1 [Syngnathoides biaculeatus]